MSQKGFLVRYISLKNRRAYMYTVLCPDPAPQRSGNNIATNNYAQDQVSQQDQYATEDSLYKQITT